MTAGKFSLSVSSPPSTSRVTATALSATSTLLAKVPCPQSRSAASIWPVWLQSSSIACLPRMTSCGCSLSTTALRSLATGSGWSSASVSIRIARSAPAAIAVRSVSWHWAPPQLTTTTSLAAPFSLSRTASSTAISSNGFMLILAFPNSTPLPSSFTRTLTLESTTRLTGTMTFIASLQVFNHRHTLLAQRLLAPIVDNTPRLSVTAAKRHCGSALSLDVHPMRLGVECVDEEPLLRLFRRRLRGRVDDLQVLWHLPGLQPGAAGAEQDFRIELCTGSRYHRDNHIFLTRHARLGRHPVDEHVVHRRRLCDHLLDKRRVHELAIAPDSAALAEIEIQPAIVILMHHVAHV